MTVVYSTASTLLVASLLGLTYSHPLDSTIKSDNSLLPSQNLSPADGWADPIWEIPGLKGPRVQYYNGGPCVNNKTIPGHTFTNGTVADATLISIFEDYNAAFKTDVGRNKAIDQMLADWKPLDKLDITVSNPVIESRDVDVVSHSAQETSLARRQAERDPPGTPRQELLRIVHQVSLVFGFVGGGAAIGYGFGVLTADRVDHAGGLNRQQRATIERAMMICFAVIGSLLYQTYVINREALTARYVAQMAVMRAQVRAVAARLTPSRAAPVEIEPSEVAETIEDIETGRVNVAEVAPEMPEGLSDGQQIAQEVEMTRVSCPTRPNDAGAGNGQGEGGSAAS